jgi:hypothetical protein
MEVAPIPRGILALGAVLPAALAIGWLVSKAQWFWAHQPDLQFGWIVLLLCAYLFWEAWENKPAFRSRWTLSTTLLAAAGFALLFIVQLYHAAFGLNSPRLVPELRFPSSGSRVRVPCPAQFQCG